MCGIDKGQSYLMTSRIFASITVGLLVLAQAAVGQPSLPSTFKAQTVASPGADIFVRSGGAGPDPMSPRFRVTLRAMTVLAHDEFGLEPLRGMGHSSRPAGGYKKKTQAADAGPSSPRSGTILVVLDAPIPGDWALE